MADLELTDGQRQLLGEAALSWVLRHFTDAAAIPVYPRVSATELTSLVAEPLPRTGEDPAQVFARFTELAAMGRNNAHPRMFGYVQSSGNFAGVIGDFLASAINQNVTSWRSAPAATTVELQVVDWLKTLVGCDSFAGGVLVGGGSAANFAALATALRASTDVDVSTLGVAALPGAPAIYASDRVHLSILKAAGLLGLGRQAVRIVPTDDAGRMDVGSLERLIRQDRASGAHLVAVVANAGEVNTGAIDPLERIADVCVAERLWLHVDGAYGGFAAAVPRVAAAFAGLSRANSLALDPHKWLFAPLDAGCLLVRDADALRRTFTQSASYIDVVADPAMSEFAFWDVSPELSRRFRALKLWFALKSHGADAFVAAIDHNIVLAQHLGKHIDESPDFERLAPTPLSIVCFRYLHAAGGDRLDDVNRREMLEVQREGDSYLSNATLGGAFALRACIVNHRTRESDLLQLLEAIRRAARRL
jgi:aromatic-L-amino-acid decarboxylase